MRKRDSISMDFVVALPKTKKEFDSIWAIMDRLTKSAHFIPVRTTYNRENYAGIYIAEVVKPYEVPSSIVLDRDPECTSHLCRASRDALGSWDELLPLVEFTYNISYHAS